MTVRDMIIGLIAECTYLPVSVTGEGNLFSDLGFDSLSFVALLVEIEGAFSVQFDITEMEACLQVERLIAMTEVKVKERGGGSDPALPVESS